MNSISVSKSSAFCVMLLVIWCALLLTGCTPDSNNSQENSTEVSFLSEENVSAEGEHAGDGIIESDLDRSETYEVALLNQQAEDVSYQIDPLDWTYWRGPENNGISRETGLIDTWDPSGGEGSNVLWTRDDLGSRSTPIVMRGKLYTLARHKEGTPSEGERVVCLDAATGETIWENHFNVYLSDVPDTRVAWSSVVGDPTTGNVYALSVCGYFQCIDGETGKTIWSYSLHEQFGLLSTYGGRTNFPVIHEDLVLISAIIIGWGDMAKPSHCFLGLDKASGEVVWFKGTRPLPYDTNYSSPTLCVINGQKTLVFGSGDGAVWGIQPRTGNHIWKYQFSRRGLNVSPIVVGNRVFTGHSEENLFSTEMGALVAIDASKSGDLTQSDQLWKEEGLMVGKSSPIIIGDRLYAIDDRAKLHTIDTKTGEAVVRRKALGTVMRSSPLYADGKIYTVTANGRWYILKPDDSKGAEILSKGRLPRGDESHGSPICSHGRIYIPTTGALYCLQDKAKQHGSTPRLESEKETPVSEDQKPSHVQVVPAEVLLKPGETQSFKARLFNSRGQFLRETEAAFKLEGNGEINEEGLFTAPGDNSHQATVVKATVGDLTGNARIRIIPPLPWKFDFEDVAIDPQTGKGEPPITWVGMRYRHIVREIDGNKVMVKVTTIPKGTRSQGWMGPPDLKDYTIQADVRGARTNNQLPDIALTGQRYSLDMQGNNQTLQIRSWVTQLRMAETIKFDWDADKWYTMKLSTAVEGEKAVVRGKVWPKGEAEPTQWTVEAIDPSPNLTGSPGFYGNANVAEIYLDNITVTPNK